MTKRQVLALLAAAISCLVASPSIGGPAEASRTPAPSAEEEPKCLACHGDPALVRLDADGKAHSLSVDTAVFRGSVHGRLGCFDCHAKELGAVPHPAQRTRVDCARCHEGAKNDVGKSIHAQPSSGLERKGLPACADCHGDHDVSSPSEPPAPGSFASKMTAACLGCHEDESLAGAYEMPGKRFLTAYRKGVHGAGMGGERQASAVPCAGCHAGHLVRGKDDPDSPVGRDRVARTCGRCHETEFETYSTSIHGKAFASGAKEAPVCTSCHGEHEILKVDAPGSKVAGGEIARTCAGCHESEKLAEKYGIPARRLASYLASYHGYANKLGRSTVANCASCHGYHDILPSSDPKSRIHPSHLAETCGQCHPGAGEHFAQGKIHVEATRESSLGVWAVRNFYTWLIGLLLLAFVTHATLDLVGKARRRRRERAGEEKR